MSNHRLPLAAGFATAVLLMSGASLAQGTGAAPAGAKPKPAAPAAAKPAASAKPAAAKPAPSLGGAPATLLGSFSDWGAYSAQSDGKKICYAASQPKARQPENLANTPAYLFVSFRPADNVRNEIALVMGFPTKDGPAEAAVGTTTFALITKGSNAWVKNAAEEGKVTAAMSKGQALIVKATSARNNATSDRYSLAGFAQALERARKECP